MGLQDGVLGPPASAPLDEKVAFFRRHGYVPVWGALEGEALRRTQAAYRQHSLRVKAEWEAAKLSGTGVDGLGYEEGGEGFARSYFVRAATHFACCLGKPTEAAAQDIPQFVEQDSSFLDLLDNEKTTEVLAQLIGEGSGSYIYSSADNIQVAHIQARTVPPERDGGYTSWHRVSLEPTLNVVLERRSR